MPPALKLLESFDIPIPPDGATKLHKDVVGLREVEIGLCQEILGDPDKALKTLLHATQINPTVAGRNEVVKHIERLGGVPLDENRDVDVTYIPVSRRDQRSHVNSMFLATDGHHLIYVGDDRGGAHVRRGQSILGDHAISTASGYVHARGRRGGFRRHEIGWSLEMRSFVGPLAESLSSGAIARSAR